MAIRLNPETHNMPVRVGPSTAFAGDAENQHSTGEGDRVDRGKAGVFAQTGASGDPGSKTGHAQSGTETAECQCGETQAGEPVSQCGAREDAVGDGVTDQAHPSQDQKHPQRRGAAGQHQTTQQRTAHEHEFVERLPQVGDGEHQATCV
jgi:hypothetical protein